MQTITAAGGRKADGLRTVETHVCYLTSSHFKEHKKNKARAEKNEKK
jgi:hypothetical protein